MFNACQREHWSAPGAPFVWLRHWITLRGFRSLDGGYAGRSRALSHLRMAAFTCDSKEVLSMSSFSVSLPLRGPLAFPPRPFPAPPRTASRVPIISSVFLLTSPPSSVPSSPPPSSGHVVIYSFNSVARGLPRIKYRTYLMARI